MKKNYMYTHTHTQTKTNCDSKRWTQLNSERRLNTRQTFGWGIPSSLLALRVDLPRLMSNLSWIRLTFSSDTRGRPELCLYTDSQICSNWWFQRQIPFLVGGWMLKRRRNTRCTAVADSVLMRSRSQILCRIESFRSEQTLLHGSALGERSSGDIWKIGTSLSNVM